MRIEEQASLRHQGVETCTAELRLEDIEGDTYDMESLDTDFMIRPELVLLMWERHRRGDGYGPWRRVVYPAYRERRSVITGPQVMTKGNLSEKRRGRAEIFAAEEVGGPLAVIPSLIPELDLKIEMLEKNLPA